MQKLKKIFITDINPAVHKKRTKHGDSYRQPKTKFHVPFYVSFKKLKLVKMNKLKNVQLRSQRIVFENENATINNTRLIDSKHRI